MNLSGDALLPWLREYPSVPWLLIYDDTALPPGELRLKRGGGSAGHNGVASVIDRLGTQQFDRLKLGIGAPENSALLPEYVLRPPTIGEVQLLEQAVERAVSVIERLVTSGFEKAAQLASGGEDKQAQRRKERELRLAEAEAARLAQPSSKDQEEAPHS
jgi:PTH1 family peptidyl-tRNA hydrolase